eukprot:8281075-Pyramimonas_sp.AAC.1
MEEGPRVQERPGSNAADPQGHVLCPDGGSEAAQDRPAKGAKHMWQLLVVPRRDRTHFATIGTDMRNKMRIYGAMQLLHRGGVGI